MLENWSLRRGGGLRELVATGNSTVLMKLFILNLAHLPFVIAFLSGQGCRGLATRLFSAKYPELYKRMFPGDFFS